MSIYNVLHRKRDDDISTDTPKPIKINSKLIEQLSKKYVPSCELKQNKSISNDIKDILHDCLLNILKKINCENIETKPYTYENMKLCQTSSCENSVLKSMIEEVFDVIFEKILYKKACQVSSVLEVKSDIVEEEDHLESTVIVDPIENQDISFNSVMNFVLRKLDVEMGKQVFGDLNENGKTPNTSIEVVENDDLSILDIIGDDSNDNMERFMKDRPVNMKEKNAIGMNNEYFHDIITGDHTN